MLFPVQYITVFKKYYLRKFDARKKAWYVNGRIVRISFYNKLLTKVAYQLGQNCNSGCPKLC